ALDSAAPAEARAGTEGGSFPFWSPDSKSIAFFAGDKLKRMEVAGSRVQVICDGVAGQPRGAAWGSAGGGRFNVGNSWGGALQRVTASGGKPERLTDTDRSQEVGHAWPSFLRDGRRFLYFREGIHGAPNTMFATSLDRPRERVRILETYTSAV